MDMMSIAAAMGPATLAGDFIGELLKFIIYLALIVCAFTLGSKLHKSVSAKKAAKETDSVTEAKEA